MSAMVTLAPWAASSVAIAKPMPWAAPVTIACFPSSNEVPLRRHAGQQVRSPRTEQQLTGDVAAARIREECDRLRDIGQTDRIRQQRARFDALVSRRDKIDGYPARCQVEREASGQGGEGARGRRECGPLAPSELVAAADRHDRRAPVLATSQARKDTLAQLEQVLGG